MFQYPRIVATLALGALVATLSSCAAPEMNCSTDEGRKAIVKAVDDALNSQDCMRAIATIEPFYSSPGCGTNDIRMSRASAYACMANINFFKLVDDLSTGNLTGSGIWETFTQIFPSSTLDSRTEAGQFALDSLFALRVPGSVTPDPYLIYRGTQHEGSLIAAHRQEDSNIYAMLVSMSLIGSLQNRYGAPTATYKRGQNLGAIAGNPNGWMNAAFVDVNACTYAGSIMNLLDTISQVGTNLGGLVGGSLGSALTTISTTFTSGLDFACEAGCTGSGGVPSGCNLPAGTCTPCPTQLKNRFSCRSQVNDAASCAAAGIVHFINTTPLGWQP